MESRTSTTYVLVLAAGEGRRLQSLTTGTDGIATPKQFCSLGGDSLLGMTFARARRLAPAKRILTVVAAEHRRWWPHEIGPLPPENVLVQPRNRGTACGILLPLLEIERRDPRARVVVLPSDHFVREEDVLEATLQRALGDLERERGPVLLLGIEPDAAEPDYGWIVPAIDSGTRLRAVESFVEKPTTEAAAALRLRGGVWNSFILAATVRSLLSLYQERLPILLDGFRRALDGGTTAGRALAALYEELPEEDFSRRLLQGSEAALRLLVVPPCGWTDLGTPARLVGCLDWLAHRPAQGARAPRAAHRLDLAAALSRRCHPREARVATA